MFAFTGCTGVMCTHQMQGPLMRWHQPPDPRQHQSVLQWSSSRSCWVWDGESSCTSGQGHSQPSSSLHRDHQLELQVTTEHSSHHSPSTLVSLQPVYTRLITASLHLYHRRPSNTGVITTSLHRPLATACMQGRLHHIYDGANAPWKK